MERFKEYDELLALLILNIQVEQARDGAIYINRYHDDPVCNIYVRMADIVADTAHEKVYILLPLHKYLWFKLKRWRGHKRYRWVRNWKEKSEQLPSVVAIASYAAESKGYQWLDIYEKIYEEFYK